MNSWKTRMTHLGPMRAADKVRAADFKIQVREIKQEVHVILFFKSLLLSLHPVNKFCNLYVMMLNFTSVCWIQPVRVLGHPEE